jgi:hypothetical protein
MSIVSDYAQALKHSVEAEPQKGAELLKNLRASLAARGYEKLLPNIYNEYQKLLLRDERLQDYKKATPEKERTRILLELYRTLTQPQ